MPRQLTPIRQAMFAVLATTVLPVLSRAEPVAYLPDGTMLVVSFNVQQFLQAPLIRDAGGIKPVIRDAIRALEGFGVDPVKDTERVIFAVGEQQCAGAMLVLLHGRFDADKVRRLMLDRAKDRKSDIQVIDEGGATVFQCRLPPPPPNATVPLPRQFYMTVLDGSTIVLAIDRSAVTEALDKKAGRRTAQVSPRVADLVGRIEPKETLSFVFVPPPGLFASSPISGLTTMTGGITVTDGIKTEIRLDAKDADAAKLLAENARDGLSKVREILPGLVVLQLGLDRKDQGAIREMVETFKVTTRQTSVAIGGSISKELVEKVGRK